MASTLIKTFITRCLNSPSVTSKQIRLKSYKAAMFREQNSTLEIQEKEVNKLDKNQVRIQVQYCSVNSIDCSSFQSDEVKFPFVPGYELSGEVIEVGKGVTNEQIIVGDRVAALSLDRCGGFAEQCVVNVNDLWRIPSNLEVKNAAVLICGHSTAVFTFSKFCNLKEGNTVVVTAGPAGLGLAAIDVAANVYKAKVIGVVDTEDRAELVRKRGAFQTLKFQPNLKKAIYGMTNKKGADVVYDAVGEDMMHPVNSCAKVNGKVFHAAPYFYEKIPAPPPNTSLMIVSLHALREQNLDLYRCMVSDTLELANEGMISAHISAKFSLKNINDAIKFIQDKKCTGKVLIEIDD